MVEKYILFLKARSARVDYRPALFSYSRRARTEIYDVDVSNAKEELYAAGG